MTFLEEQILKITDSSTRIVYPESMEPNIIRGAAKIAKLGIGTPVMLGNRKEIEEKAAGIGIELPGVEYVSWTDEDKRAKYASLLSKESGLPESVVNIMLKKPLYFGAMMVKAKDADGIIAGINIETDEVVAAYKLIVGMAEGIRVPSCITMVEAAHYNGSEGNVIAMADMAINIDPTSEELADIALSSAYSVKNILEWEPRIAMLSFSTLGSSNHARARKIAAAAALVKERDPELKIDGELQLDAAVIPEVAARKVKCESAVAGKANVLVFPNLDASNIGIKLLQRFGGASSSGGVLQGFARPVCDLSRGATEDNVLRNSVMLIRFARAKDDR